ncbi:MAG: enoyl-CoA hydratase/isomerase family protein [FCB group bacterium]|nr:enoyl-CoA hydratase/isomerase family protein [FCB group bacterium]
MESSVKLGKNNGVTLFILDHRRANAIDNELLEILSSRLAQIDADEPLLLMGNGKFFSAGLDLLYCETLSKSEFENFIEKFQHLLLQLVDRPGPVTALLNGHAVAGGFLLAAGADRVLLRPGPYAIGLNEAKLGFSLPAVPLAILKNTFPDCLKRITGRHEFYTPEQIAVFSPFEICVQTDLATICKKVRAWAGDGGWAQRKKARRKAVHSDLQSNRADAMQRFYREWWSEKAVSARTEIIGALKGKNG